MHEFKVLQLLKNSNKWTVSTLVQYVVKPMEYLQQEDEVVDGVVARVQVVLGTQPVAGVELHLLVYTGVAEEVEQDPL